MNREPHDHDFALIACLIEENGFKAPPSAEAALRKAHRRGLNINKIKNAYVARGRYSPATVLSDDDTRCILEFDALIEEMRDRTTQSPDELPSKAVFLHIRGLSGEPINVARNLLRVPCVGEYIALRGIEGIAGAVTMRVQHVLLISFDTTYGAEVYGQQILDYRGALKHDWPVDPGQ